MDIITAYQELGSYRAAAKLCGTTDKTVKQVVERQQNGERLSAPSWGAQRQALPVKQPAPDLDLVIITASIGAEDAGILVFERR